MQCHPKADEAGKRGEERRGKRSIAKLTGELHSLIVAQAEFAAHKHEAQRTDRDDEGFDGNVNTNKNKSGNREL